MDIGGTMLEVELKYDEHALKILKEELSRRTIYKWKKADGTFINVKDMSDTHLKNTIKKLEECLEEQRIVMENYADAMDYYD